MRGLAITLLILSGISALIAFSTDVSVSTGYSSIMGISVPSEVANLHGMHIQTLMFQACFMLFLASMISFGFAEVVDALRARGAGNSSEPVAPQAPARASVQPAYVRPEPTPEQIEAQRQAEARGRKADLIVYIILGLVAVAVVAYLAIADDSSTGPTAAENAYYENLTDPLADNMSTNMYMDMNPANMNLDVTEEDAR